MDFDQIIKVSELIASIAVIVSLIYLAIQVRYNSKVSSANARHAISQFGLDFSKWIDSLILEANLKNSMES